MAIKDFFRDDSESSEDEVEHIEEESVEMKVFHNIMQMDELELKKLNTLLRLEEEYDLNFHNTIDDLIEKVRSYE